MNKKKEKLTVRKLNLKKNPKLIISKEIQSEILFAHSMIKIKEWSGILLYKEQEGGLNNLNNLKLKAEHLFLQDIGSSAYTEYQTDAEIVEMYDTVPNAENLRTGQIHTHHSGSTFFSGTDQDELENNAVHYDYYLSLIVNFEGSYKAKIVIPIEHEAYRGKIMNTDSFIDIPAKKEILEIDVDIAFEADSYFLKNYNRIEKKYKETQKKRDMSNKYNPVLSKYGTGGHINSHTNPNFWENDFNNSIEDTSNHQIHISPTQFVTKLVSLDEDNEDSLDSVLSKTNSYYLKHPKELEDYEEAIVENFEIIMDYCNIGVTVQEVYNLIKQSQEIIRNYSKKFPKLVKSIQEGINNFEKEFYIVEE